METKAYQLLSESELEVLKLLNAGTVKNYWARTLKETVAKGDASECRKLIEEIRAQALEHPVVMRGLIGVEAYQAIVALSTI